MPMPRLTSMPSRSSSAMRLAMTVCASMASALGDEVVDERGRRDDMVRRDQADGNDVVGGDDHGIGGHGDHRIEVATGQRVGEIAQVVGHEGMDQREVG